MELVCPAGNLPSLKAAIDNGADAVYLGFRDDTNARHFAGLNFSGEDLPKAIAYARERGRKVFLALNTYPRPDGWPRWQRAVDRAAALGVDALIAADLGVLDYAAERHPGLRLHLSVQASATNAEAIRFHVEQFGVQRVVLPRVLSLAQVQALAEAAADEGGPGGAGITKYVAPRALLWFRWAALLTWLSGAVYLLERGEFVNAFLLGNGNGDPTYGLTIGVGAWLVLLGPLGRRRDDRGGTGRQLQERGGGTAVRASGS